MTDEEIVKQKWPDAWCSTTGSQNGGPFYCIMKPHRKPVENIGEWCRSEAGAWADAAKRIQEPGA